MNPSIPRLLIIVATASIFANAADSTPERDRERLEKMLAAKQFWAQPPEAIWTEQEVALFNQIAVSGREPAVRLRARKILIDFAGNGRATPEQAPMVAAAFRYMEQNIRQPAIARLLAWPSLTHYIVSTNGDGTRWVLLESTAPGLNRGGINLRWNADTGEIAAMKAWGSIASD